MATKEDPRYGVLQYLSFKSYSGDRLLDFVHFR